MIHLLGRESEAWLRGEVRGRTGIFPSNYVEILEDLPTPPPPAESAPALPPKTERPPPPTMKPPPPPVTPPPLPALFFAKGLYDYAGPEGDLSFSVSLDLLTNRVWNFELVKCCENYENVNLSYHLNANQG